MQTYPGVFIVLEGSDGSGKSTQFELLKKRLIDNGYDVEVFDFPRYDKASSHFVQRYLNGQYGPASSISPYTASLFYALDRFEAGSEIKEALAKGKIVLSNRYVGSNMAHQGAKFNDPVEKRSFFVWEDSLEFQLLNIPRPDINIFLRVPAEVSYELIKQKTARTYTQNTHDEHEADIGHLKRSVETYDLLCELFPKDYKAIECVTDSRLSDIETINSRVWEIVSEYLPEAPQKTPPQIKKRTDFIGFRAEAAEQEAPENESTIQEFKWRIKRLSLQAITELNRMGYKVAIEWKNSWDGEGSNYDFYIPDSLPRELLDAYKQAYLDAVTEHQKIYQKLHTAAAQVNNKKSASHLSSIIARRAIPMGALFQVSINLNKNDFGTILSKLRSHSNPEISALEPRLSQAISQTGLKSDKVGPETAHEAAPAPLNEIISQLALNKLPQNHSDPEPQALISATPRNEFELLADSLFSLSDLSREDILLALDTWSYQQKTKAMSEALSGNRELLSIPTYKFDVLTDRITLLEIFSSPTTLKISSQQPTVRYGYDVPPQVEESGADDLYIGLFDNFLELFNQIQVTSDEGQLPYATLSGHKVRWQTVLTAQALSELSASISEPLAKDCINSFKNAIAQVHPQVANEIGKLPAKGSGKSSTRPKKKKR